eukprot:Gb_23582 [translate_table: standard]
MSAEVPDRYHVDENPEIYWQDMQKVLYHRPLKSASELLDEPISDNPIQKVSADPISFYSIH